MPFSVREELRSRIEKRIEALEKGYRQNVAILAPEGFGKTRILSTLFSSLVARPSLVPVCVSVPSLDYSQFIDRWCGALLTGLFLSQGIKAPESLPSLIQAAAPIIPKTIDNMNRLRKAGRREKQASVRELFALPGNLGEETGKKVVLMLDEFQALAELPASDPFGILGREIMVQKSTLYLVTSSKPMRLGEILRDKLSLLFGNFEVVELGPLNFSETFSFLKGRFPGRVFSDVQKKYLMRLTNAHPVYLDLLMDQLEIRLSSNDILDSAFMTQQDASEISLTHLIEAFHRELSLPHGRLALRFLNRLQACDRFGKETAVYRRVLLAVSHGRRKAVAIANFIDRTISDAQKILQRLVQEEVIEKCGAFYTIEDPLFRFWLREVYQIPFEIFTPEESGSSDYLREALTREWENCEREKDISPLGAVEALFNEFRNDVLEWDHKKLFLPHFSEVAFKPAHGSLYPILARNAKVRWLGMISLQKVREEDIAFFVDEAKRFRKALQKKVIVALAGIDQNAKLMAQEAKIHVWNLRLLNQLLDLYSHPKLVLIPEKEENEAALGALAQSVHSA